MNGHAVNERSKRPPMEIEVFEDPPILGQSYAVMTICPRQNVRFTDRSDLGMSAFMVRGVYGTEMEAKERIEQLYRDKTNRHFHHMPVKVGHWEAIIDEDADFSKLNLGFCHTNDTSVVGQILNGMLDGQRENYDDIDQEKESALITSKAWRQLDKKKNQQKKMTTMTGKRQSRRERRRKNREDGNRRAVVDDNEFVLEKGDDPRERKRVRNDERLSMDEFGEERKTSRPKRGDDGKMSDRAASSRPRRGLGSKKTMSKANRGNKSRAVEELKNHNNNG